MSRILSELRLYICNNWINKIPSHRIRKLFYRKIMNFKIGKNCAILMGCTFDCAGGFSIGNESVINANCRIDTRGGIKIGSRVVVSNNVIILTADHDLNSPSFSGRTNPVLVHDYAWIGTRSMILPNVTIYEGAAVAAGAVVTKDIPPYTIVAGIPATFLKTRSANLAYETTYKRLFQ